MSAAQAARRLGVKPSTLYSYVSRGLLTSVPGRDGRSRRYIAEEVEALHRRAEAGRGHGAVAAGAMGWGQPVVDTRVSEVGASGPRYRGVELVDLLDHGFEAVADHLWGAPAKAGARWPLPTLPARVFEEPGQGDAHAALIALLAALPAGEGEDPEAERARARWLLRALACARAPGPKHARAAARAPTLADALAWALDAPAAAEALDVALVVCAEHELNASTFAARIAASTGADLQACLIAALAAHSGPKHGGASSQVEALVDEAEVVGPVAALRAWRGPLPGCGHRLYPEGDPRFDMLMQAAQAGNPTGTTEALAEGIRAAGRPLPNLDFGLVGLRRAWDLPRGSAPLIFLLGRVAGWVAHVLEERQRGQLIRPRARYVGP
ncbi:MAG: helix-turn-helix domain-containing protein [Alphaproteobacteria bacterium]|nr:helix-turn-helix domain-containing protein [Alphaproteobacteria bacterium]